MNSVSSQTFYHHPAWFHAYFDRPDVRDDIYFRCAYAGDRLFAVLPIYFKQKLGGAVRIAKLPDYDGLYMPDMAISDDISPSSIWREMTTPRSSNIKPLWDVFSADNVLEGSAVARSMFSTDHNIVTSSASGRCAFVDVLDYEKIMGRLKKKFRGNLNNAKHRLRAESEVEFVVLEDPELLHPAFDKFVDLELASWKGQPDKVREKYPRPAAIGLKKSKYLFYRNTVREFGKLGAMRIFMLKVRENVIGAQLCIILNDVCYLMKTTFDDTFGRYSPGHLIFDFSLRQFAEGGTIKEICLITDYGWFKYWNPRYSNYLSIKAFAKTAKGRSASVLYSLTK